MEGAPRRGCFLLVSKNPLVRREDLPSIIANCLDRTGKMLAVFLGYGGERHYHIRLVCGLCDEAFSVRQRAASPSEGRRRTYMPSG